MLNKCRSGSINPAWLMAWKSAQARCFKDTGLNLFQSDFHTHTRIHNFCTLGTRHLFWQTTCHREREKGHRRLSSTKLIYVGTKTELIRAFYTPRDLPVSFFPPSQGRKEMIQDTTIYNTALLSNLLEIGLTSSEICLGLPDDFSTI